MAKVRWRPDEPARDALYIKIRDRLDTQDSCITFLLNEIRALQKRVAALEARSTMKCPYYPGCQPEHCTRCWEHDAPR